MSLIPGIFINGKFKPLTECNNAELKSAVYKSKIKLLAVAILSSVFAGIILSLLVK